MRRLVLIIMFISMPLFAAEEAPPVARVVENIVERVPDQTVVPQYPRKARRDRIEGEVQVCFEINRKGRPRRVAVRNSSNRVFERPSILAVRESTFRPVLHGEPVPQIKSCRTFIFSLEPVAVDDE